MEQQLFGVVIGASSLLAGYVLHELSNMRSKELSYLQLVPQFSDMTKLRKHLSKCPEQKAEVLVEGVVKKLGPEVLKSEKAGIVGAAKLVTTTLYKKVRDSKTGNWSDYSNTVENQKISIPFQLVDRSGGTVTIASIHNVSGFRQLLERVWQDRVAPESRSIGDFATNAELQEIPDGSLTREFLLTFGTSLGAYGAASLENQSFLSNGEVKFRPYEVSSSIHGLIARNETVISALKFFSVIFLVGGGGILLLSAVPLVLKAFGYTSEQEQEN
jgi:hypothetical protein